MVGMSSGLLSLALLGWAAAADHPSPSTLSPACVSARPSRPNHACVIRLGQRGNPLDRRGRKLRDDLDDDDSDDETSSGRPHAEAFGFPAGLSPVATLIRSLSVETASARRPGLVPLIYAYCTLLL